MYVIRKTKARAMLIECCFCDNQADVDTYKAAGGADAVAKAICNALIDNITGPDITDETAIMGNSVATAEQLNGHLLSVNPRATGYLHLAQIFIDEGAKEGVRGDGAFCQALIETGYFKFGGDVQPGQHNYAGPGATGGVPGLTFADDRTGIRAQIQHLKAYATAEPLVQACVDPRYKHVSKGCAPSFERLAGKWAVPGFSGYPDLAAARAAKDTYGDHIAQLLSKIVKADVATSQPDQIAPAGSLWIVQAGAYSSRNNAEKLQKQLENMGVISMINLYKV